jgi:hypothetical protein
MRLYAPSNQVKILRHEVMHTYNQISTLLGWKNEICICIKTRSLVITIPDFTKFRKMLPIVLKSLDESNKLGFRK